MFLLVDFEGLGMISSLTLEDLDLLECVWDHCLNESMKKKCGGKRLSEEEMRKNIYSVRRKSF